MRISAGNGWWLLCLLAAGCGARVTPRPEPPLAALESRLTRPSADASLARLYVARASGAGELERARDFFQVMAARKPDEPLYPFGAGLALRALRERDEAIRAQEEAVAVASRPEPEAERGD